MSQELYSVEQVAGQLGLHVRTVRKYIRDGRLKAVRIGKQYRVAGEDLRALTGGPSGSGDPVVGGGRRVELSGIVQIDGIDRTDADRLSTLVTSALNSPQDQRLQVRTLYTPDSASLKVILVGDLAGAADLLRLIAAVAADHR